MVVAPKYSIALVICRKDYPVRKYSLYRRQPAPSRHGLCRYPANHRWDYNTPIEETLEALNDVVKPGKRVISARHQCTLRSLLSTGTPKTAWLGAVCQYAGSLNLIYREEEREMLPLCYQEGVR